jgi:hypothetical protein
VLAGQKVLPRLHRRGSGARLDAEAPDGAIGSALQAAQIGYRNILTPQRFGPQVRGQDQQARSALNLDHLHRRDRPPSACVNTATNSLRRRAMPRTYRALAPRIIELSALLHERFADGPALPLRRSLVRLIVWMGKRKQPCASSQTHWRPALATTGNP